MLILVDRQLRQQLETNYHSRASSHGGSSASASGSGNEVDNSAVPRDPMIYPGLYAPSGFDMMGILVCFSSLTSFSASFEVPFVLLFIPGF